MYVVKVVSMDMYVWMYGCMVDSLFEPPAADAPPDEKERGLASARGDPLAVRSTKEKPFRYAP